MPPETPPSGQKAVEATAGTLTLAPSADGLTLQATYNPPNDLEAPRLPLQLPLVLTALIEGGWGTWWRNEPALNQLVQQALTTKLPLLVAVAECRSGRADVQVARDRMSATLSLEAPQGGAPLSLEQVKQIVSDKGIRAGLLEDALAGAVAAGRADQLDIARGQPAVNGEHTRFEPLVPNMPERHPHIDEDGMTDFRDLGDLVVVKAGTPLMRRHPPTAGTDGFDVQGTALRAKPGANKPFAPGLKGAGSDPNDADLLVATVTGQPVVVSQGVKVDPNMVLPNVDLSTGNVKFDGAVNIKGDVKDGMKVFSTGDVLVGGAVLAGEIEAHGNVTVKGGIIGRSEYDGHDSDRSSWFSAKVVARGQIHARYAENAFLEAEGDVLLDEYAMHCEITSLTHVHVGKPGGKKGRCIGGHTRATVSVQVAESGSEAGPKTVLEAGHNPLISAELASLQTRIAKHKTEVENLQKIIDFVMAHPERNREDMLGRAYLTQELHQGQVLELEAEQANLNEALHLADDACVMVDGPIHGGTEVRVGGKVWHTAEQRGKACFRVDADGNIALS